MIFVFSKIADPVQVFELGRRLMLHHKISFPWAVISPSVHMMAAHSWQLFVYTEGKPIAIFAEHSVEGYHKCIRAYRSGPGCRSRQTSMACNIEDIFKRLLTTSSPRMAHLRRQHSCSRCGLQGHTVRSCSLDLNYVESLEESMISQCYI